MRTLSILGGMLVLILAPGCASTVAGTQKTLRVTSDPAGALVRLDGVTRALTPGIVHPSTRSDHVVEVLRPGYRPVVVQIRRVHSAWNWGNVVFGLAPGIAFDAATGAIYSFKPDRIDVKLEPLPERTSSK